MAQAPDLTLTLRDGGFLSILPSTTAVRPREDVKGTHRPEGIFVAAGPGVRRGERIATRSILDVAPTLLWSVGAPVPEDFEGEVVSEAFTAEALAAQPVRRGEPTRPLRNRSGDGDDLDAAEDEVVLRRLKALGYVE
jgi:hypothetical protein